MEKEAVRQLEVFDFGLALLGLMLLSGLGFLAGVSATLTVEGGIRVVLGSVVAGLGGYVYYGSGGPGSHELYDLVDTLAPVLITLGTGLFGLLTAWWTVRGYRRA